MGNIRIISIFIAIYAYINGFYLLTVYFYCKTIIKYVNLFHVKSLYNYNCVSIISLFI